MKPPMGQYNDGDYVVVCDERSSFFGHIGVVKKQALAKHDHVHIGGNVLVQARPNLRRIGPGDVVTQP